MKRLLIILVVALLLGSLAGGYMAKEPGYLLVAIGDFTLETSLWVGAALLVLSVVALFVLLWVIKRLLGSGKALANWRERLKRRRNRAKTTQGMIHLAEGDWHKAQKKLTQSAQAAEAPLPVYLAAARAAASNEDLAASEALLQQAHKETPNAELAIGLTKAEMEISRGQHEQALASLLHLRKVSPKNKHVLSLLQKTYLALNDWEGLKELLPTLRKYKVDPEEALDGLEQKLALALMQQAADSTTDASKAQSQLQSVWRNLNARVRRDPEVVLAYVNWLAGFDVIADGEIQLRKAIEQGWSESLVNAYGLLPSGDPGQQLIVAENWLKERPDSAELMLALARIALRNQLWGKARDYYISSQKLHPTAAGCAELGRLLESMGDQSQSVTYNEKSLELLTSELPKLPLPEAKSLQAV